MITRVGRVTKIYPTEGRVKVTFEDSGSSSMPLAMITMNKEYSMPSVGDRVVTLHMDNGTSKGFVLGTYYGGGMQPMAGSGYRKDFTSAAFAICKGGVYTLNASSMIQLLAKTAGLTLDADAVLVGTNATLGSGTAEGADPETYFKATEENAEVKATTDVSVEAEGGQVDVKASTTITITADGEAVQISATGGEAELMLDSDTVLKATSVTIEASDAVTLTCGYGTVTVEQLMKRLERLEDLFGLPHTA